MIPIKLFVVVVLATFSAAVSAQWYPQIRGNDYKHRFDASEETIREIDYYLNDLSKLDGMVPGKFGYEILALFEDAREVLAQWNFGDKMCSPEAAKSLEPFAKKFATRHTITDRSEKADDSIRGWLVNRMIECIKKYHEQHGDDLQSMMSIIKLGIHIRQHRSWIKDDPERLWADYFYSFFSKSQDRVLKSKVLSSVGITCLSKKFFDQVFDEQIKPQCAQLDRMKDAVGFALFKDKVPGLASQYSLQMDNFIYAHDACRLVAEVGQDQIRRLTLKGYKCM